MASKFRRMTGVAVALSLTVVLSIKGARQGDCDCASQVQL